MMGLRLGRPAREIARGDLITLVRPAGAQEALDGSDQGPVVRARLAGGLRDKVVNVKFEIHGWLGLWLRRLPPRPQSGEGPAPRGEGGNGQAFEPASSSLNAWTRNSNGRIG